MSTFATTTQADLLRSGIPPHEHPPHSKYIHKYPLAFAPKSKPVFQKEHRKRPVADLVWFRCKVARRRGGESSERAWSKAAVLWSQLTARSISHQLGSEVNLASSLCGRVVWSATGDWRYGCHTCRTCPANPVGPSTVPKTKPYAGDIHATPPFT